MRVPMPLLGVSVPAGGCQLRNIHEPHAAASAENYVKMSAAVRSTASRHEVVLSTGKSEQSLPVPPKPSGQGSSVSGGEFLMLALATCYCNDLYREAARLGISIESVEVEASAEFPGIGLAATNIAYRAKVSSPAAPAEIAELLRVTDAVAEIHNTVRAGVPVALKQSWAMVAVVASHARPCRSCRTLGATWSYTCQVDKKADLL